MKKLVQTLYFSAVLPASNILWAADGPSVEPISTAKIRFQHVQVEHQDGQYVLSGKIKRSKYNSQVAPGHIDYIVLDSTGKTVAEGAVSYSPPAIHQANVLISQ